MFEDDLQHLISDKHIPRKRIITAGLNDDNVKIKVPLPELDFNDPDFLKLLKEYEEDSDSSNERKQFESQRNIRKPNNNILNNGFGFTFLTILVLIFIVIINWFNSKELERLKEEFGFEDRHLYTEQWWKRGLFYTIHVPSFADSNNNGVGDINGIRKHLNDFEYLGVDAVILTDLTSFYEMNNSKVNHGATLNFTNMNPLFGNFDDLRRFIQEANEKNIKVIIQIDPNHTHLDHDWFIKSRSHTLATNNIYKNYYVWNRGKLLPNKTRVPPNNWLSTDGSSAWHLDSVRDEFYYHVHSQLMPDLNHRNPDVRKEMLKIFKFWLDKGAAGLLLTSIANLLEIEDIFLDEPQNEFQPNLTGYRSLQHVYTLDQPDVHDYISTWRQFYEEYFIKRQTHYCLLLDVGTDPFTDVVRYYHTGADAAVVNPLIGVEGKCAGECIHEIVDSWIGRVGEDAVWMRNTMVDDSWIREEKLKENVDIPKKYNLKNVYNILMLLLPGSAIIFKQDLTDPHEDKSMVELVHRLSRLRRDRSFLIGQLKFIHIDDNMLAFVRFANGERRAYPDRSNQSPVSSKTDGENNNNLIDKQRETVIVDAFGNKEEILIDKNIILDNWNLKESNEKVKSKEALFASSAPYVVALNFGEHIAAVDLAGALGSSKGRVILTCLNTAKSMEGSTVDLLHFVLQPGEGMVFIPMLEDEEQSL